MFSNQCLKESLKSHLPSQSPTTNLVELRDTIEEADIIESLHSGRLKRTQHTHTHTHTHTRPKQELGHCQTQS